MSFTSSDILFLLDDCFFLVMLLLQIREGKKEIKTIKVF